MRGLLCCLAVGVALSWPAWSGATAYAGQPVFTVVPGSFKAPTKRSLGEGAPRAWEFHVRLLRSGRVVNDVEFRARSGEFSRIGISQGSTPVLRSNRLLSFAAMARAAGSRVEVQLDVSLGAPTRMKKIPTSFGLQSLPSRQVVNVREVVYLDPGKTLRIPLTESATLAVDVTAR